MEEQINPKQSIADLEGFEYYVHSRVTQGSSEWMMARKGLESFLVVNGDRRLDFQGSDFGRYWIESTFVEYEIVNYTHTKGDKNAKQ